MSSQRDKIRERLSAYHDGELSAEQARAVEEALRTDSELSAELASLGALRAMLRSQPRAAAPPGVAERVLERAERAQLLGGHAERAGRSAGWWLGRLAAAAVIIVAVGIGALVVATLSTPSWVDRVETRAEKTPADRGVGGGKAGDLAMREEEAGKGAVGHADGLARQPAKPRRGGPGAAGAVPVAHFFINTDDLVLAQREVERVLLSNDIRPARQAAPAQRARGRRIGGNFYNQTLATPSRVEFEVVIDDSQLRRISRDLNAIRARQDVAQVPLRDMPILGLSGKRTAGVEPARIQAAQRRRGQTGGPGLVAKDALKEGEKVVELGKAELKGASGAADRKAPSRGKEGRWLENGRRPASSSAGRTSVLSGETAAPAAATRPSADRTKDLPEVAFAARQASEKEDAFKAAARKKKELTANGLVPAPTAPAKPREPDVGGARAEPRARPGGTAAVTTRPTGGMRFAYRAAATAPAATARERIDQRSTVAAAPPATRPARLAEALRLPATQSAEVAGANLNRLLIVLEAVGRE